MTLIDQPGVYDLPEADYHADPLRHLGGSLSSTAARTILRAGGPAIVAWDRTHTTWKKEFDEGSAAHKYVLGKGAEIHLVEGPWNTNVKKAEIAEIRAAGHIALKPEQDEKARAMAGAILEDPWAGPLFNRQHGVAEQVFIWRNPETGIWCRAMLDWQRLIPGATPVIVDVKTTTSIEEAKLPKTIAEWKYHQQRPHYEAGFRACKPELGDPAFLFVFVTKTEPYLVRVVDLDDDSIAEGYRLNRRAVDRWRDCVEADDWPAHPESPDPLVVGIPRYAYTD